MGDSMGSHVSCAGLQAPACETSEDCYGTELDKKFMLEVQELLTPQAVTQLLEEYRSEIPTAMDFLSAQEQSVSSEQDSSSNSSSCSTPSNPLEMQPNSASASERKDLAALPKKHTPRTRTSRKSELESLRSQVADLDKMLKNLQLAEMKATAERLGDVLLSSNAAEKSPLDSANRKLIDHMRAVLENLKLRSLFIDQKAIGKELDSVFRNRPAHQIRRMSATTGESEGLFQSPAYDLLRASIDARYLQIDSLLRANGLGDCDDVIRRQGYRTDVLQRLIVESVNSRAIPFHRSDIARVVMCIVGMDTVHTSLYQLRETLDDTVHIKVVENHRLSKTDTTITARIVVKQFEESERSVILWEQCLDVEGVLPMRVRGNGFHVLRAPLVSNADTPVSIFQSLSQVSPDPLGGQYSGNSRGQDSAIWDLTKLALSSYYCNTDLLDQVIQAVLVSESATLDKQMTPSLQSLKTN